MMDDDAVEVLDMEVAKALQQSENLACQSAAMQTQMYATTEISPDDAGQLRNDVTKPRIRSVDGGLDARVAGDADIQIKRIHEDVATTDEMTSSAADVDAQLRALTGTLSRASATFAAVRAKASEATDSLNNAGSSVPALVATMSTTKGNLAEVKGDMASTLVANEEKVASDLEAAQNTIHELLENKLSQIRNQASAQFKKLTEKQEELIDKVVKPLDDVDAAGGQAVQKLTTTHFNDKKAVVYRWNEWHTYNNCCVGWFDGNNPRGFGGRHPSQWGDGNALAHDMHPSMRYMKRLFSKRGYGDAFGATVCALTWEMPHSTDDRRCGAFFRIKNTGTNAKTWSVQWHWTGWHGWGNYASVAINKGNHWHGHCYSMCYRNENFNIPANSAGNRISSIAFISGGTHPYGHYNHHRMVYLSFQKLDVPDGLEFVDDMETVGGEWR